MAAANYPSPILDFTLREEGGWADNSDDPGGATMKGVTLATFQSHYPGSTADDLRNITEDQLAAIYRNGYWNTVRGDDLPAGVDLSVFDFGVNAGPRRSVEMLQSAVGVDADGDLGPISMAAISAASPATVVASLSGMQRAHYESLDTFDVFGAGWLARNERRLQAATALIPTAGATA